MPRTVIYPRYAQARLEEALADTPVVLVHGPRQCGKTTLARQVGDALGYVYITFDEEVTRAAAQADPTGFVSNLPERVVLDEVQRIPELFATLKHAVDRDRRHGRFLLTGSSNVLLRPRLSDSLAGRMEVLHLHPLSQSELARTKPPFLENLFDGQFPMRRHDRLQASLGERIVAGGFPAALARPTARRRSAWYRGYLDTIVQRDVRDLIRIASLDVIPRLLEVAAGQTACLLNVAELAEPFRRSRPTIREYVTLLENIFVLEHVPPWHSNRLKRLIKTPKLHIADTGLAAALLRLNVTALIQERDMFGRLLETFVFQELRRQASWYEHPINFHHFRDRDGAEVDIVLERGASEVVGVEVKAAATVTSADFRGLRKFKDVCGKRFVVGVVLYDGETAAGFGDGMFAVPISALWEEGR